MNQPHTQTQKDYSGSATIKPTSTVKGKRAFTDLALQDTNVLEKLSLTHSSHMTDHEALYTTRICSRKNSQRSAHRF